jgi:sulfur-oxidizing protein SoxB
MSLTRREFLEAMAAAVAGALPLHLHAREDARERLYTLPRAIGKVTFLHFTDCHAQLLPVYFREPDTNIGTGTARGQPPHLVGEALLRYFRIPPGTALAHAHTHINFTEGARRFGKLGGFAHLATLLKMIRAQRPGALLLDGGDSWQGSATALWSQGRDMMEASKLLGVTAMTGHWEFTYGAARVQEALATDLAGSIEFIAQNVTTADFGDPVFRSHITREVNGVPMAIIGQAFPYTPIANPRHFVPDWTFGIQEERLQRVVDEARKNGAWGVVLLSHNGMDVDLKLASRVSGIDAILGGHTHDAVPRPTLVKNRTGQTIVTNAGSNGKFLAVLDLDIQRSGLRAFDYRLLPVFSNLLEADTEMSSLIASYRTPHLARLQEKLAVTEGLLYRRGNFNGTFDELILEALMQGMNAEIAFSPGFRWGTTLLPGTDITFEDVMNGTAITYPQVVVSEMTGETLKNVLEDICDNVFNPDPYYQQGGDMVRVGGLQYTCDPVRVIGKRISNMRLRGRPVDAQKRYKVVSWAPVAPGASGDPVWEVLRQYLRNLKVVTPRIQNRPSVLG